MIEVDVRELLVHPGASRNHRLDREVEGLRLELAAVPEGAHVQADLLLERVVEGILVSGTLTGPLRLTCARCLTEFDGELGVDVQELFARPGPELGPDEYALSPEDSLDLEPLVRDNVLPDPWAVTERIWARRDWLFGAPYRPEAWPGMPDVIVSR